MLKVARVLLSEWRARLVYLFISISFDWDSEQASRFDLPVFRSALMAAFASGFQPTALPPHFRPHVQATAFALPQLPCNLPSKMPDIPMAMAPAREADPG